MTNQNDPFNYQQWVEDALRTVVRATLSQVAESGLVHGHYLYITFFTTAEGVHIPDILRRSYPVSMTIVLQHEFWNLLVEEDAFEVTLSFNNVHQPLRIPYHAVSSFTDPSVQFGLQLHMDGSEEEIEDLDDNTPAAARREAEITLFEGAESSGGETPAPDDKNGGEVIALETFRKK